MEQINIIIPININGSPLMEQEPVFSFSTGIISPENLLLFLARRNSHKIFHSSFV